MLYNVIKNLIAKNYYEREDMTNKLNVFMIVNQIKEDQYLELIAMIYPAKKDEKPIEKPVDVKINEVKPSGTVNTNNANQCATTNLAPQTNGQVVTQ